MSKKRAAAGPLGLSDMDAKHASLMQDYLQLQHEFAELKDRLQAAKLRKSFLLGEVRFLRRRLKKLKQNPSDLKDKDTAFAVPHSDSFSNGNAGEPFSLFNQTSAMDSAVIPPFRRQFDLNESSIPNLVMDNTRLVSALKTSGFRKKADAFVTEMAVKRRISWQDQISLECN